MKCRKNHHLAVAAIGARWLSNVGASARAFQYDRAAQRDERNGFIYAAAMEWRKAAELFPENTRAAEYFWRQWERVMHLPRRLAGPFDLSPAAAILERASLATRPPVATSTNQILLPAAV